MKNFSATLLLASVLIACSSGEQPPATDSVASDSVATQLPDTSSTTPATPKAAWTVSEAGIGPVHAGMTLQEARDLLPALRTAEGSGDLATAACAYARAPSLPSGAVLLFEKGRIARVDLLTGSTRTVEGAGIGDTEARLQSLYEGRVKTTPHKYNDKGHYLTVESKTDSTLKIVFETDGVKVLRFRSGKTPAVEYVEGCG